MMNIIVASRLRGFPEPNTFIGNAGNNFQTASDLAALLDGVVANDITLFSIENNNIKCRIDKNYELSFTTEFAQIGLTYYIDLEGKCINNAQGNFRYNFDAFLFYFPNLTNAVTQFVRASLQRDLSIFYAPNVTNLGGSVGDDLVMQENICEYFANPILETNNGGNPDGDIQTLISNGGSVVYKDLNNTNQTTAPTASTISTKVIGGIYLELNVSQPTHLNTLKYPLVFVDGFFQDVYDINNVYALNLQEQTSYNIKVIIADEYFNISPYSNALNVTTTTTPALFRNAVAYYKLDELNGNAIDVVNRYNGNLFGGVTRGVAGKIGTAYSFDGTGYIDLGVIDYDEIQISCWFKTNDNSGSPIFLFGQGNQAKGEVLRLELNNGVISSPVFSGVVEFGNNTFNDGNWHLVSISLPSKISNTSEFKLKVDNVLQPITSDPNINMNIDTTQPFIIGAANNTALGFKGEIDEFLINNTRFSLSENSDLYNNGIGTTI